MTELLRVSDRTLKAVRENESSRTRDLKKNYQQISQNLGGQRTVN